MGKQCCAFTRDSDLHCFSRCRGSGFTAVNGREAKAAIKYYKKAKPQHKGKEYSFVPNDDDKIYLCAECGFRVLFAKLTTQLEGATSKRVFEPREAVNDILQICRVKDKTIRTEAHRSSTGSSMNAFFDESDTEGEPEEVEEEQRVVPTVASSDDPLDVLWPLAREYFRRHSFMYDVIVTSCRVVLQHSGWGGLGRNVFDDHLEGQQVVRFWSRLWPYMSESFTEELIGGTTSKGEVWRVEKQNLIFVPSVSTLRRHMGTPYPVVDVLTITSDQVNRIITVLGSLGLATNEVAVTLDKISVSATCAVVDDWPNAEAPSKRRLLLGGATKPDLSGAVQGYDDVVDLSSLLEDGLATGFLSLVVSHLEKLKKLRRGLFSFAIPIGGEGAEIVRNIVLRLRHELFRAKWFLIHGGGDGANLPALKSIEKESTGTITTICEDCTSPEQLPFTAGTDSVQHDVKHMEQTGEDELRLHGDDPAFRAHADLRELRGVDAKGKLVSVGSAAHLAPYFNSPDEAQAWHFKYAPLISVEVVQRRDAMKTSLSIAAARTYKLVGEIAERHPRFRGTARFLKLVWLAWCASRGVDMDEKPITAEENLAQFDEVVAFLTKWHDSCPSFDRVAGSSRPAGFITLEQLSYWRQNRNTLKFHVERARHFGRLDKLCSAMPTSERNESPVHSQMRRFCPGSVMNFSQVAGVVGKTMACLGIGLDPANSFVTVDSVGKSYISEHTNQSFEERVAAIQETQRTGEWFWPLTRDVRRGRAARKAARAREATADETAEPVGTIAVETPEQRRHLSSVAAATRLNLERSRVLRDLSQSGKFGISNSEKLSRLEERIASPHMWLDSKVKGAFYTFSVADLVVLEHAAKVSAARFTAELRTSAISCVSAFEGRGLGFLVATRASQVLYTVAFENIVAACFGKIEGAGFHANEGVVVVTLVAAHATMLQAVSFTLKTKDASVCKRLVNQQRGAGTALVESKYVAGDTISERTKVLLAVFRRGGDDASKARGDLAARLGSSWTSIAADDALHKATGLGRISRAVAANRADGDDVVAVPSLADVMTNAPSNAKPEGMFVMGEAPDVEMASAGRTINCWNDWWEIDYAETDAPHAKRMFEEKYVGVVVKFKDFVGRVEEFVFCKKEPAQWVAKARSDDAGSELLLRTGAMRSAVIDAKDLQPASIHLKLPAPDSDSSSESGDSDDERDGAAAPAADAEVPATTTPSEAPKRPLEVASDSTSIALRRPKRNKGRNQPAGGAGGG